MFRYLLNRLQGRRSKAAIRKKSFLTVERRTSLSSCHTSIDDGNQLPKLAEPQPR